MTEHIDIYLKTLNYHKNWLAFGVLTEEILAQQINEFNKGDDINTEHYRYYTFLDFIRRNEEFSDLQIEQFIILTNQDADTYMVGSALKELYLSDKLSNNQNELVESYLANLGKWAEKLIERKRKTP